MTVQLPLIIIAGYSCGLGEAIATYYGNNDYRVVGLSRTPHQRPSKLEDRADFVHICVDLNDEETTQQTFAKIFREHGAPTVLVHNVAKLLISPFAEIDHKSFVDAWRTSCLSAFHCAQACLPVMEQNGGTIIFTGATASVRGSSKFGAFASAKFALRGLAQALAREYSAKNIHVVHALIDGLIWGPQSIARFNPVQDTCLHPDDIADAYFHLSKQPRSAWTHEIDLRPASEVF